MGCSPKKYVKDYTESLLRPLRRRFLSTARPPGVALRTKKPCVVLRFLFFGLYVWDIVELLYRIGVKMQAVTNLRK